MTIEDDPLPESTELVYMATAEELSVILELLGKGFTSYSNVFRVALHNLARQLQVDVPRDAFQLRSTRPTRAGRGHTPQPARTRKTA